MKYILIFFIIVSIAFSKEKEINSETYNYGHFDSINKIIKHPKRDLFISIGKDEQIISWNFNKNKINFNFEFNSGELYRAAISPNGNFLLVSNKQGHIYLINYNTFKLIDAFNYLDSNIIDFYFINNYQIAIVYQNKKIILFDIFKKEKSEEIDFDKELVATSYYNNTLAVAERDGKISLIRVSDFKKTDTILFNYNKRITALHLVNSNSLITAYESKRIDLINLKEKVITNHFSTESFVSSITSNKQYIVLGLYSGKIKLYSKDFQKNLLNYSGHEKQISSLIISGNEIISSSKDPALLIWKLPSEEFEFNKNQLPIKKFSSH